jgi:hypothetical protein
VLISAAVSAAVGVSLFWQPEILRQIRDDIAAAPHLCFLAVALTSTVIMWPERRNNKGD